MDALLPSDAVVLDEGEEPGEAVAAPALAVAPLSREAEAHALGETLAQGEGDAVRVCVTDTETDTVGVEVCEGVALEQGVPVLAPRATVNVAPAESD